MKENDNTDFQEGCPCSDVLVELSTNNPEPWISIEEIK